MIHARCILCDNRFTSNESINRHEHARITDHRSLEQMTASLAGIGYQAVLKDWENPAAV